MSNSLRVVVQQPQFLPWAGLWAKYLIAEQYVVYAGVKFDKSDHQHRVTINNGVWLGLPISNTSSRNDIIKDVRLSNTSLAPIAKTIRNSYMGRKWAFRDRLDGIVTYLEKAPPGQFMLDVVHDLFLEMGRGMGLKMDNVAVDTNTREDYEKIPKLDKCLEDCWPGRDIAYYAGGGGLEYMGYDSLNKTKEVYFQKMLPHVKGDSMLEIIAGDQDPLDYIRNSSVFIGRNGEVINVP